MSAAPTKILLVEDNPSDRSFMDACIQDAGAFVELHHAGRLAEASSQLKLQRFEVVIADLNLPDTEGLDTFFKVKEMASDAAIVVLTGMDDGKLATSAVIAGAQDYLVKGELSPKKVWQSVSNAIQRQSHLKRVSGEVHDLRKRNSSLREMAYIDPLTGLCNRRGLNKILAHGPERRGGSMSSYALLVDVDDFKTVNDLFGYNQGDVVLKDVGRRIRAFLRPNDIGSRVGGDEFLVLAHFPSRVEALALAESIRASVSDSNLSGGSSQVTVSIGVVALSRRPYHVEDLLELAQGALHMSKGGGKNRVCFDGDERSVTREGQDLKVSRYPFYEIGSGQIAGNRFALAGGTAGRESTALPAAALHELLAAAGREGDSMTCLLELSHLQLMQVRPQDLNADPEVEAWRMRLCIPAIPMSPLPPGLLQAVRGLQGAGWGIGLSGLDLGAHSWSNLILLEPTVVTLDPSLVTGASTDRSRLRGLLRLRRALAGLGATIIAGGVASVEDVRALDQLGIGYAWGSFFNSGGR